MRQSRVHGWLLASIYLIFISRIWSCTQYSHFCVQHSSVLLAAYVPISKLHVCVRARNWTCAALLQVSVCSSMMYSVLLTRLSMTRISANCGNSTQLAMSAWQNGSLGRRHLVWILLMTHRQLCYVLPMFSFTWIIHNAHFLLAESYLVLVIFSFLICTASLNIDSFKRYRLQCRQV